MTGIGPIHGAAAAGGMGDVAARIAAIQSRIDGLTGSAGRAPIIDAAPGSSEDPIAFELADASFSSGDVRGSASALGTSPNAGLEPGSTGATLAATLPDHARPWAQDVADAALRVGVDPSLFAALVRHESDFDPSVVSHAGAIGLAQLMPGTAAGMDVDPHDALQNLAGGARYLRAQLDRFGSVDLALAAYNAGPNRVAQAGGVPRIPETLAYVDRVTATWEQLR